MANYRRTHLINVCLSDLYNIPTDRCRIVKTKDGKEKTYVSMKIVQSDHINEYGYDGFLALNIKKDDKRDGEQVAFGDVMSEDAIFKKWGKK